MGMGGGKWKVKKQYEEWREKMGVLYSRYEVARQEETLKKAADMVLVWRFGLGGAGADVGWGEGEGIGD